MSQSNRSHNSGRWRMGGIQCISACLVSPMGNLALNQDLAKTHLLLEKCLRFCQLNDFQCGHDIWTLNTSRISSLYLSTRICATFIIYVGIRWCHIVITQLEIQKLRQENTTRMAMCVSSVLSNREYFKLITSNTTHVVCGLIHDSNRDVLGEPKWTADWFLPFCANLNKLEGELDMTWSSLELQLTRIVFLTDEFGDFWPVDTAIIRQFNKE